MGEPWKPKWVIPNFYGSQLNNFLLLLRFSSNWVKATYSTSNQVIPKFLPDYIERSQMEESNGSVSQFHLQDGHALDFKGSVNLPVQA